MGISFLGLSSNIDSAGLVNQLVALETQAKVQPLQIKKSQLNAEKSFVNSISSKANELVSSLSFLKDIHDGDAPLVPRTVESSDTDEEYISVTADGDASPGTYEIEVLDVASSSRLSTDALVKKFNIETSTLLADVTTLNGASITSGDVTINGQTQTFNYDPATTTLNDFITFVDSFTGITSSSLDANEVLNFSGVESFGSPGDSSNVLKAMGLANAVIGGTAPGEVRSVQNLGALSRSETLNNLGITGSTLTVNGVDISYDPNVDNIDDLLDRINNSAAGVAASYDNLGGFLHIENEEKGALAVSVSSDGNFINQFNLNNQQYGSNTEYFITGLNGVDQILHNENYGMSVTGTQLTDLIPGLTIDFKKATDPGELITVAIKQDPAAYKTRVEDVLTKVNGLITDLEKEDTSFARSFISRIKTVMGTYVGGATDNFLSLSQIGITGSIGANNEFTGYKIDDSGSLGGLPDFFENAFNNDLESMNKILFGKAGTSVDALSNGSSGIFIQLEEAMKSYTDYDGVISSVQDSLNAQIKSRDRAIERAEEGVASLEERLRRQYSQLDLLSVQASQQQAAVSALVAQLG